MFIRLTVLVCFGSEIANRPQLNLMCSLLRGMNGDTRLTKSPRNARAALTLSVLFMTVTAFGAALPLHSRVF
jgi:hypothetical protein